MKRFTVLLPVLATLAFVGCSNGTPKCADTETKDLVVEIAKDELKEAGMEELISRLNFEVDAIRTTKHNKDVDSYECAADFKMIGEQTETLSITYTVESTDDTDEFYVTVYGL